MTNNQLPTIKIKDKEYVLVKDRIIAFNDKYPNGSITTERFVENDLEVIKAIVTPDCDKPNRIFTGYSQARRGDGFINKTSCLENAETSAVGRALAFMGIGVVDSIASVDEINKAETQKVSNTQQPRFNKPDFDLVSGKELYILSFGNASDFVNDIKKEYKVSYEMIEKLTDLYNTKKLDKEKKDMDLPF